MSTPPTGKEYWRSLDDLADSPQLRELLEREFPTFLDDVLTPASRRQFLKIMGASVALAGMTACRWPKEEIVPFAYRPEGVIPGVPRRYATAFERGGAALGLLVTSLDGRPIKVEGNPAHPASLGATDAFAQALVLELYDPDRSRGVESGAGSASTWDELIASLAARMPALRAAQGRGLAVLARPSS
jgi:MoCo/4Fe-4S cofactor protein with predicted Tat translocation signal